MAIPKTKSGMPRTVIWMWILRVSDLDSVDNDEDFEFKTKKEAEEALEEMKEDEIFRGEAEWEIFKACSCCMGTGRDTG